MASSTNISEVNAEFRWDDTDAKELYEAIMEGKDEKVEELCRRDPQRLFKAINACKDTVLHMAADFQNAETMVRLLRVVPKGQYHKLTTTNYLSNTALHEAATSDNLVEAVREMLEMEPKLLQLYNKVEESPIYRAARFGQEKMFEFLDSKIRESSEIQGQGKEPLNLYRRKTGNNVLHAAVGIESFGLAHYIADRYPKLVGEIDPTDRKTALQILACKGEAFRGHRVRKRWPGKRMDDRSSPEKYDAAVRLAESLVEADTTWKDTKTVEEPNKPKIDNYGDGDRTSNKNIPATPLFLAIENGCLEIVEAILKKYPSAVEDVDAEGRTILHAAIKYEQKEILKHLEGLEIPMRRLQRKVDSNGNSILHMVGIKPEAPGPRRDDDTQRPAFQLREQILFFEHVQTICADPLIQNKNKSDRTAKDLFAETNNELQKQAKDWIKRTAEQCLGVALFIATVAFTAAYTIPGGPNQSTGFPILLDQPLFFMFTMSDVLSLTSSLTSVIMFLSILTSPMQLWDFKRSLLLKLMLGIMFLTTSVSMMMLGFAATIILMIRNREQSAKIALYAASFLPVSIFAVSQLRLFWSLIDTFFGPGKKRAIAGSFCSILASPFFSLINPLKEIAGSFCGKPIKSKPQPPPPPIPPSLSADEV